MCGPSPEQQLRELNIEVTGSIRQAEAQRLIHKTLFDAERTAYASYAAKPSGSDATEYVAWCNATKAWRDHIAEHKTQAAAIRAERVK